MVFDTEVNPGRTIANVCLRLEKVEQKEPKEARKRRKTREREEDHGEESGSGARRETRKERAEL